MENTMRPVTFVVPGDLHLTEAGQENHRVALRAVEQINTVISPDFVQFIGDNAQEATPEQFRLFNALCARLTVPYDVLVGDHDVHKDPQAQAFERFVGETYGVRAYPGVCFLRLNTQQAKPLGMTEQQIAWFGDQVDLAQAHGERIVVFQHNYPYQIWENYDGPGMDAWRTIVQSRRIEAIFSGHTHYFQIANDGRNVAVAVRSIGDPEGGDPGYLVGTIQGDDLAIVYRAVDEVGPVVLVTHPRETLLATGPKHVVRDRDEVRVKIWSEQAVVSARCRIDDRAWMPLSLSPKGEWHGELCVKGFAKGVHRLQVEASDVTGQVGRREQTFVFDPTGRYTSLPAVWPTVTRTQFC